MNETTCIHGFLVTEDCEKCDAPSYELKDDNVKIFPNYTEKSLDPDIMLRKAIGCTNVVVIVGWDKEGELFFSSSEPAGPEVLWLLEKAKQALLEIGG